MDRASASEAVCAGSIPARRTISISKAGQVLPQKTCGINSQTAFGPTLYVAMPHITIVHAKDSGRWIGGRGYNSKVERLVYNLAKKIAQVADKLIN